MELLNLAKRHKVGASIAAGALSLAIVGGGFAAAGASDKDEPLPSQKFKVPAGTTADGRTYGSILDADQGGPTYDIFAAQATNGKIGYVDRKQYDALQATVFATGTPGEVPDAMKRVDAGEFSLPVYDVDGKTKIGEYVLGGAKFKQAPAGTDAEKLHNDLDRQAAEEAASR